MLIVLIFFFTIFQSFSVKQKKQICNFLPRGKLFLRLFSKFPLFFTRRAFYVHTHMAPATDIKKRRKLNKALCIKRQLEIKKTFNDFPLVQKRR